MWCEIVVWSRVGHTPITNRVGSFCDELVRVDVECDSPKEAEHRLARILRKTPHAANGYFNIAGWWNQNTRSGCLSAAEAFRRKKLDDDLINESEIQECLRVGC